MAKAQGQIRRRNILSDYWQSSFVDRVSPQMAYMYLYLFCNQNVTPMGIYRITSRTISSDLKQPIEETEAMMSELVEMGKIYRYDTWIFVTKFLKYNPPHNDSMRTSIVNGIASLEPDVREWLSQCDIETLSEYAGRKDVDEIFHRGDTVGTPWGHRGDTVQPKEKNQVHRGDTVQPSYPIHSIPFNSIPIHFIPPDGSDTIRVETPPPETTQVQHEQEKSEALPIDSIDTSHETTQPTETTGTFKRLGGLATSFRENVNKNFPNADNVAESMERYQRELRNYIAREDIGFSTGDIQKLEIEPDGNLKLLKEWWSWNVQNGVTPDKPFAAFTAWRKKRKVGT